MYFLWWTREQQHHRQMPDYSVEYSGLVGKFDDEMPFGPWIFDLNPSKGDWLTGDIVVR